MNLIAYSLCSMRMCCSHLLPAAHEKRSNGRLKGCDKRVALSAIPTAKPPVREGVSDGVGSSADLVCARGGSRGTGVFLVETPRQTDHVPSCKGACAGRVPMRMHPYEGGRHSTPLL